MTYEEALAEKELAKKEFLNKKLEVQLVIAPHLNGDQKKFIQFYTEDNYTDELCLLFSTDNQYTVLVRIKK